MTFPFVGGHEGGGIVERIGRAVTHVKPDDHVLLTYSTCRKCAACSKGMDPYCLNLFDVNFTGFRADGTRPYTSAAKASTAADSAISSFFFGQSSFAQKAIVNASSAVAIPRHLPLETLAPLGCGIQTGAGSVLNVLRPQRGYSVAIFGAGAVGMAALMAASITPAEKIIVVDVVDERLEMAKGFGATHVINGRTTDVAAELKRLTAGLGVDRAMDTTANIRMIQDTLLDCVAPGGIAATVGAPPMDQSVHITPATWIARGVSYVGIHQGSSVPQTVCLLLPLYLTPSHVVLVHPVPDPALGGWPAAD